MTGTPGRAWLTTAEVAALFQADDRSVIRWAGQGKLTVTRTPGGHRRYSAREVRALLAELGYPRPEMTAGEEEAEALEARRRRPGDGDVPYPPGGS